MRGIRDAFLVITLFAVLLIGLYIAQSSKEGFDANSTELHNRFVQRQQATFNPLSVALLASNSDGNLPNNTQVLLGTPVTVGTVSGVPATDVTNRYPQDDDPNTFLNTIRLCEAVKTADCSAFDDPKFSKNCGVCVDIGKNSEGKPTTGGLVLMARDREYYQKYKRGNRLPDYSATIGACPAQRMSTSKAECLRIKKEMACQKGANFDLENCSQCYADGTYFPVDSNTNVNPPTLYVIGNGILSYVESGYEARNNLGLSDTPIKVNLQGKEAIRLTLNVSPRDDGTPAEIAGYLEGITSKGKFTIDIQRIIQTDAYSGRKPRMVGPTRINDISVNKMRPGFGQKNMSLIIPTPFTFVDTDSLEGDMCSTGPFITKRASAEFLDSDPCYKKGTGPGSYTQECLQNTFYGNGCLDSGTGFPSTTAKSSVLLTSPSGANRTLNDIAAMIYENAVRAATGMSSTGTKLSIEEWSTASVFCTGKQITSPCDTEAKETGPLTKECLNYMWKNEGAGKPLGATYNTASSANSLFSTFDSNQFCQAKGALSPVNANGSDNTSALTFWRSKGGVERVRGIMREIHRVANADGTDQQKQDAVKNCYGQTLAARPEPAKYSTNTCKVKCGHTARYVRIQGARKGDAWLQIAQLAVIDSNGVNVALGKPTTSGSQWPGTTSGVIVDGDLRSRNHNMQYHSYYNYSTGRWEHEGEAAVTINLGGDFDITRVVYFNRADCCQDRIIGAKVTLYNMNGAYVADKTISSGQPFTVLDFRTNYSGECLKCESSKSEEVFWIAKYDAYIHRPQEGASVCSAVGAKQATFEQLLAAQKMGMDVCATGWVSNSGAAYYPIYASIVGGCGNGSPGLKHYTPPNNMAGIWCYGVKPPGELINEVGSSGMVRERRRVTIGGQAYFIRNFDSTKYNAPESSPGNSI